MILGFREFEFDLPDALLTHLIQAFDNLAAATLSASYVKEIPEVQGVYQLFLRDKIVYIGKTDAEAGLRRRLERHAWTIQHRRNLGPEDVTFKALRVFVFTAMDLETQLIRHYQGAGTVSWNNSGFGSNDPGRQRDTTNAKPEGFDAQFPIDLDRELDLSVPVPANALTVLAVLKRALPYTLRVETEGPQSKKPHPDLVSAKLTLQNPPFTARRILKEVLSNLPGGWQATTLPGRVIVYKENRQYSFGEVIVRS
jgi:hypothetical protein